MNGKSKLDDYRYEPIHYVCGSGWDWASGNIRKRKDGDWVPLEIAQKLEQKNIALTKEVKALKLALNLVVTAAIEKESKR